MNTMTGAFDTVTDVGVGSDGTRHEVGSTVFSAQDQTYTFSGGGKNIWAADDEFHFAARRGKGDFILTVQGELQGNGKDPHRKWGIMFRESLDGDSAHADATVHGDGLTSLQYRPTTGAQTLEVRAHLRAPDYVQLERSGKEIIMRAAERGEPLVETGRVRIDLPDEVYTGLFVCAHDDDAVEKVVCRNFRSDAPAATGVDGYRAFSPSRLEILDVDTGHRRVIYTSQEHFEAPNWSRDGSYLLYNQDGRIFRFPLDSAKPAPLDTGDVEANNNDHGISFDGTKLALSSAAAGPDGKTGSAVFVVPIEGGKPFRVTERVPSYWHGWSPDGTLLVYCAERGGSYSVYSIPVAGGAETQLTSGPALDDGPEFSPDGNYIYFNSTRTGQMKIWRMKPDGSGQEQVSTGDFNDWFAHPSPDGTRIVYVSYPLSVAASSHPHNQRVMIREQSLVTGKVRILAHLYGGQGTMNVPSWSPDGRHIAFVSYTYGDPSI